MAYKTRKKPEAGQVPWNPKHPPTEEQEEAIEFVADVVCKAIEAGRPGAAAIIINAVAGSGKTTCLLFIMHRVVERLGLQKAKVIIVVFSAALAKETLPKIPLGMECRTKHSLGLAVSKKNIGNIQIHGGQYDFRLKGKAPDKIKDIIVNRPNFNPDVEPDPDKRGEVYERIRQAKKLVEFIRSSNSDWNDQDKLEMLCDNYSISFDDPKIKEQVFESINEIMQKVIDQCEQGIFDFTDMYWFTVYKGMSFPHYDLVLADEAQDNNVTDHEFLARLIGEYCGLFVGDEYQSIMGFAGAMPDSMQQIKSRFNPTEFAITYNFRCGRRIIEAVQHIVPHIKAWDGAPDGEVIRDAMSKFDYAKLRPGSLALSRLNSRLVGPVFQLLRKGIPANIKGDDLSIGLKSQSKRIIKECKRRLAGLDPDKAAFEGCSRDMEEQEIAAAKNRKYISQSLITRIQDKYETLRCISENVDRPDQIHDAITRLFADPDRPAIMFSSEHRSKGLEAEQVAILGPPRMSRDGMKPWELEQERNLEYVAKTRAMKELYLLEEDERDVAE